MRTCHAGWNESVDLTGRTAEEARHHLANLRRGIEMSRDALSSSRACTDESWRLLAGKLPARCGRHGADPRVVRRLRLHDRLLTFAATAPDNGLRADLLRLAELSELEATLIARSLHGLDDTRRALSQAADVAVRVEPIPAGADAGSKPSGPAPASPARQAVLAAPAEPPGAAPAESVQRAGAPTAATRMRSEWELTVHEVQRNHMRCQEVLGQMASLARTTEELIVVSRASMRLAEDVLRLRVSQSPSLG
jgi:hypothetical protein